MHRQKSRPHEYIWMLLEADSPHKKEDRKYITTARKLLLHVTVILDSELMPRLLQNFLKKNIGHRPFDAKFGFRNLPITPKMQNKMAQTEAKIDASRGYFMYKVVILFIVGSFLKKIH